MKQENRLDPLAKSPDPDDLSREDLPLSRSQQPDGTTDDRNPDVSEPHVPPPDDYPLRRRPAHPESD
jgi:hypothetical protein